MTKPIEQYLTELKATTYTKGPFVALPHSESVSGAWSRTVHGMISFVNAARVHPQIGYVEAAGHLVTLVEGFEKANIDVTEDLSDKEFDALFVALLRASDAEDADTFE